MYIDSLRVTRLPDITSIECILLKVHFEEFHLVIGGYYRPTNSDGTFFEALNEFMCRNHASNLVLTGDFNTPLINWDGDFPEALCASAEPLVDIVSLHGLTQLVNVPTRTQGDSQSILDLFIISDSVLDRAPRVDIFKGISDHKLVCLNL